MQILHGILVLVVESDTTTRAALGLMLEHQGAHVVAVGSVQAAQEILANRQVDVLVCSLRLPDGDGGQVLSSLQRRTETPELATVTIALTTDPSENLRNQAIAQGFQACLVKPFEAAALLSEIVQQRRWTSSS